MGSAGGSTHYTHGKRPFWLLWLIGMGKVVGFIGLAFGTLIGGSWMFRTYPRVGDVFCMFMIACIIAFLGLVSAPKR